jgi:hypothetical protein
MMVSTSLALLNHVHGETQKRRPAVGIWAVGASLALTAALLGSLVDHAIAFVPRARGSLFISATPLAGTPTPIMVASHKHA